MSILSYLLGTFIFQIVYLLVPKIEICLKYFLDKILQKQATIVKT